jgi:hypothetical protein
MRTRKRAAVAAIIVAAALGASGSVAQAHPPDCSGTHWDQKAKDLHNAGYKCTVKDQGLDSGTLLFEIIDWSRSVCAPGKVWWERWEMYYSHFPTSHREWRYVPRCA